MISGLRRTIVLMAALMVAASVSAVALRPTARLADLGPKVNLEEMVPKQFGDWRIDQSIVPLLVSPDVQATLDRIYDQTLARTYINKRGERVMLSIAYGSAQTKSLQVHRPEVCYPAQGFQVGKPIKSMLETSAGTIPVVRLAATSGARREPITYWVKIGDATVLGRLEQKLALVRHGLSGVVPDGVLVRVSSLSRDDEVAYALQDAFLRDLLMAVPEAQRSHLLAKDA